MPATFNWSFTEPDVNPPTPVIDTMQVIGFWMEPSVFGRSFSPQQFTGGGQEIVYLAPTDSVEQCAFVQFGDSAVGRFNQGAAASPNCSARLAAHAARWRGLSARQQAIVDTMRVYAVPPNGGFRESGTTNPPMAAIYGYRIVPHGVNGGGWRRKIYGS